MILATRFTFIVERSWKNMYFHPKLAWPPATYDVISRNHSNWPSLNSSQNMHEGWTNSYWKRQVLMFYSLEKELRETLRGLASTLLYVRGLNNSLLKTRRRQTSVTASGSEITARKTSGCRLFEVSRLSGLVCDVKKTILRSRVKRE